MRFSLRNRRGCRKGEAGGESLQEDSHHYRFYGRGGQRPHERDDTGKLQSASKPTCGESVADELERIKSDPALVHLLQQT